MLWSDWRDWISLVSFSVIHLNYVVSHQLWIFYKKSDLEIDNWFLCNREEIPKDRHVKWLYFYSLHMKLKNLKQLLFFFLMFFTHNKRYKKNPCYIWIRNVLSFKILVKTIISYKERIWTVGWSAIVLGNIKKILPR